MADTTFNDPKPATTTKKSPKPSPASTKPDGSIKKYEVSIEGGFTGVFEGPTPAAAQAAYCEFFGVRGTTRKMTCTEVTNDPDAGELAVDMHAKQVADREAELAAQTQDGEEKAV